MSTGMMRRSSTIARWSITVAALLGTTGCAAVLDSGAAASAGRTAEQARERLIAGVVAQDTGLVRRMIALDARARLIDGTATVPGTVRALAAELIRDVEGVAVEVEAEGARHCTGAVHEYGTYTMYRLEPADAAFTYGGRYSVLWDTTRPEAPELRSVSLYLLDARTSHRALPCKAVPDSLFDARRLWLGVYPGALLGDWHDGLSAAVQQTGWSPTREAQTTTAALPNVAAHYSIAGAMMAAVAMGGISGSASFVSPMEIVGELSYSGVQLGAMAGIGIGLPAPHGGGVTLTAGPSYLRLNGSWAVHSIAHDRPPEERWSTWSVGLAGDVAFLLPLTARLGVSSRFQYRYYPAAAIPGYVGSDVFRSGFGHSSVLVGIGAKVR